MSAREGGEKEREGGRVMKGYVMNGGLLKKIYHLISSSRSCRPSHQGDCRQSDLRQEGDKRSYNCFFCPLLKLTSQVACTPAMTNKVKIIEVKIIS